MSSLSLSGVFVVVAEAAVGSASTVARRRWRRFSAAARLRDMPELLGLDASAPAIDEASKAEVTCADVWRVRDPNPNCWFTSSRSNRISCGWKHKQLEEVEKHPMAADLDVDGLRLTPIFLQKTSDSTWRPENRRMGSPSTTSEESL